ncbi:universal stress protein [Chamaesiphon sp. VAR_48_metabat_135_sub]|uniref:universal stress protein n=1 Tax=Chamaesiphon sp. VAR_48_metabat_135_sub TaxID=2964699 RepID=UPI00286BB225|nr:universal stress protein [Chamaesiphon sp. VAR_48_metabat_135_sub]
MLQKILIATGDAPESEKILATGLTLAEKFGAEIGILHVLNLSPNGFEAMGSPLMGGTYPIMNDLAIQQYQQELQAREQDGMERLQSYARQAHDRHIKADIYQSLGDPGRTICELATNNLADLIVMGRNQKSVLSEIFLGSTSNYVLHHAPCSVMMIQHN